MKLIFVIKDEKVGGYGVPVFSPSLPSLMRDFTTAMRQSPDSLFAQHPADFSVWRIGEWDEVSGQIKVYQDMEYQFHFNALMDAGKKVQDGKA